MNVLRWRTLPTAALARRFSSCPPLSRQDADIIRRLRRQERLTSVALQADIDDFLHRLQALYKPKSAINSSTKSALLQTKYISTERLKHDENVATLGSDVVKQFTEIKDHLKDLEVEPYPRWQPGDSDIVLRRLSDPSLKLEQVELERKIREKETNAGLDNIQEQHKGLEATKNAWITRGRAAAEAVANDFVGKRRSDYAHVSAALDPVDLDTISEDMPGSTISEETTERLTSPARKRS